MRRKIVVVGSSNTDMVVATPRLPLPGESVLGNDFVMAPGGKGANQAVAAARLGGEVILVARLGQDIFGDQARKQFQEEGIDTRFVTCDPHAPSGTALIMVGPDGQNIIAVAPGANARLTVEEIQPARGILTGKGVILLQLEIPLPTVLEVVQLAHAAGSGVILNPAPAQPLPPALYQQVDLLTPNETEALTLTGSPTIEAAAQELLRRGVKTVIVTLGAGGVLLGQAGQPLQRFPGYKVSAVDTTAAGDAFNGGLAVAVARGELLEAGIRFAQAAAALSVTRRGAQPSLPTSLEVEQFLQSQNQ
jgi:ribokinase